ncbi:riboflavin synthase subunit alpha [Moraxella macacae 0408225]|uniref:Riboflavin synthase n=1 Tax=Moraxella macacae 0408225 TaxID=1230338 RepID=L2F880_9GAMM|nr:riboflavin synthase [Moraxella macacae]ELA09247.1 riboflavin synthase subunit alpha [Moraxella macacae 0408225]
MFTGIIEATGFIKKIESIQDDIRLSIQSSQLDFVDVKLGDSIACNGICLTVVDFGKDWYAVDVSRETIAKTTMNRWQVGDTVNLEKAMLPTTRFGGHIVSGHVDTVGCILLMKQDARSIYIEIDILSEFAKYVATKGSVTVDGISLTTNLVKGNVICLNIIPHTASVTNIGKHWRVGSVVNIEVDILARYLERLLMGENAKEKQDGVTLELLADNGFLK